MKNISLIIPVRENIKAFSDLVINLNRMTKNKDQIELLCAVDADDIVFKGAQISADFKIDFYYVEQSDYFTRDYWNYLAKKAQGRWVVPIALGCQIITKGWDEILVSKMNSAADNFGDDIVHGLIKDNIPRKGEDPQFPNFSCHPVISRKHVEALGYFFDERYWAWGCDPAVTIVYKSLEKILNQNRIISLTEIEIVASKDIHTTTQADLDEMARKIGVEPNGFNTDLILKVLRLQSKSYQKFLKISQEHPYTMTIEDSFDEARKLEQFIRGIK